MWLWAACSLRNAPYVGETGFAPGEDPPALGLVDLRCDADDAVWKLEATATGATGGGTTWWTVDGLAVEEHEVPSVARLPDGSEELALSLDIEDDPLAAKPDASTSFRCLSGVATRFGLRDVDGKLVACTDFGDPAIWDLVPDVPPCL